MWNWPATGKNEIDRAGRLREAGLSTSHTGHLFWRAEQGGRTVISYPECLLVSVEFGKTVAQFQIP